MSRTFKDRHDQVLSEHVYAPHALAAQRRARHDTAFAVAVGFYTGLDDVGNVLPEDEAKRILINVLTRGQ